MNESLPLKKYQAGGGELDTEIRFLRKGDLFWREENGKPVALPEEIREERNHKVLFYVAVGNPIWAREKNGVKKFLGIRYREASENEIRKLAFSRTTKRPRS